MSIFYFSKANEGAPIENTPLKNTWVSMGGLIANISYGIFSETSFSLGPWNTYTTW